MRLRNTIIVLILFALVGGYAFIVGRYTAPEESRKLLAVKSDDIAKIELKYPDRDIVLEGAQGGPWRLKKPIGADADQSQAHTLANAIATTAMERTVEEKPPDLKAFELEHPKTIVTVTTFDKKTLPSVEVGRATPIGFNAYVKLNDNPAVLLTSSVFPSGMNKTVNDLRVRDLMSFKMDDVRKLIVTRDNGQTVEVDLDGEKWKMVKPAQYPADDIQVRQALSTLVNAKASDFVADAPASVTQYGLEKPHLTATVVLNNGEQQSLLFGFKQNEPGKSGYYVRRGAPAPVYAVPGYLMSTLDKSWLDYRDRTVFAFEPSAVESVKVKNSNGEVTFHAGTSGKWDVIVAGQTSGGDIPVVERVLSQLRNLKGSCSVADPT